MEIEQKLNKLRGFLYNTLIGNVLVLIIILASIYALVCFIKKADYSRETDSKISENVYEGCTVAGIGIHGTLLTYIPNHAENDTYFDYDVVASEEITWSIDNANADENIKAILVEVDSVGGSTVAGEEISNIIKNSEKPVIAFIREFGTSSAYWAVSSADKIFASKNSNVGGIGITMSYLSGAEKNINEGYVYQEISVGKYKDAGSPDKPLSSEEKAMFLRDSKIVYENFISQISENRKLPIEQVRKIADGATVLGEKAKELGLIDEIGSQTEAEKYLEETIGEEAIICWQ